MKAVRARGERIGLATVTSTCGSAVCAKVAVSHKANAHENALYDANIIFNRRRISNSDLIGMTCEPMRGYANRPQLEVLSHCSDGVRRRAGLEKKMNAVENLRGP